MAADFSQSQCFIFSSYNLTLSHLGKTTVAGIYGRILKDLGLLSKGDVIIKNPSDFTGGVLGESEQKTVTILDAAVGCVLVIDEAYGLYAQGVKDPYKVLRFGYNVSLREQSCMAITISICP